jgi:mono/diheme cytochrome c family protein
MRTSQVETEVAPPARLAPPPAPTAFAAPLTPPVHTVPGMGQRAVPAAPLLAPPQGPTPLSAAMPAAIPAAPSRPRGGAPLAVVVPVVALLGSAVIGGGVFFALRPKPRAPAPMVASATSALSERPPIVKRGEELYQAQGCARCHDGEAPTGGTLRGLAGTTITLSDMSTVTADENYLRESLSKPEAKVRLDLADGEVMPPVVLSDDDVDALIAYMKSLTGVSPESPPVNATARAYVRIGDVKNETTRPEREVTALTLRAVRRQLRYERSV